MNVSGPDMGNASGAGIQTLFESDGHGRRDGRKYRTFSNGFLIKLVEFDDAMFASFIKAHVIGGHGGRIRRMEVED